MNANELGSLNELTRKIIGAAHTVSNSLGCGFLEKVYENALAFELRAQGLLVTQQQGRMVRYRGEVVGEYFADLVVEDRVIVELKTVQALHDVHQAQCLNYLRATGFPLCLLINFARPRLSVRRVVNG